MWKADVAALASASALAAAEPLAAAVSRVAKILDADDAALREGCAASGWHALLVAKLYYEQPALLRWQLRDGGLLAACLPTEAEAALPPFEKALVGCLRDNPYEMLEAARAGWGDGWLLAHMWDLLWRARPAPPHPTPRRCHPPPASHPTRVRTPRRWSSAST